MIISEIQADDRSVVLPRGRRLDQGLSGEHSRNQAGLTCRCWPQSGALFYEVALVRLTEHRLDLHGQQVSRAQTLPEWDDGRAAVDIVDLDVAGATCFAARRMRLTGLVPLKEEEFDDLEPLAMVSLSVVIGMANESLLK